MRGYYVLRRAGWDTHGLPVELGVEKELGLTRADIGIRISIADYNRACQEAVMRYKAVWDELTQRMGYWVRLDEPYITFDPSYIESVWHLLKSLYDKGLLYKSYTIQPYSPAAGTALSQHELNLPGAYRSVKDPSLTVQFQDAQETDLYYLAWTTTPWTLPANAALAVEPRLRYVEVETFQPHTRAPIRVILAEAALPRYFTPENADLPFSADAIDLKRARLPHRIRAIHAGETLVGRRYLPLFRYVEPQGDAWRIIPGDFISTEEGTGIVHVAPTFGADDLKAARLHGIAPILASDEKGHWGPIVDREGKFVPAIRDFAGRFVKNYTDDLYYHSVDEDILAHLKVRGLVFRSEKYEHNYPHCWRTDKPILYYPVEAWFIRMSALRERLVTLNKTIAWYPPSIGEGRFGNWLENIEDWNLSRTRFWGIPLPIWRTADGKYERCIGSFAELHEAIDDAVAAHLMSHNPLKEAPFDPHRPYVDAIILKAPDGSPMYREPDVIDVWFDSGAMPYAQWHYPFENQALWQSQFPADFIAEGIDQTRGWFYTLHAIAVALFDSVAYRRVLVNGLVLDKNGNKMSKRLGNVVDPFDLMSRYGADPVRWYLITNAPPWENVRFDENRIAEKIRHFFTTLYNVYDFFALYANIDGYEVQPLPAFADLSVMDRWLCSRLESLTQAVLAAYEAYHPTEAGRLIEHFVVEELSNWYVRRNRRRFWKGEKDADKWAAFSVLRETLLRVAALMAPIAPFSAEILWRALGGHPTSVHEADFPESDPSRQDPALENAMDKVRRLASLIHSLRKRTALRVRQPLSQILLPKAYQTWLHPLEDILLDEVNVKTITYLDDQSEAVRYELRPNYRVLGQRLGPRIKAYAAYLQSLSQAAIQALLQSGTLTWEGETFSLADLEVRTQELSGWLHASEGGVLVALDTRLSPALETEGLLRELVHLIQVERKNSGLEVTDRIYLRLQGEATLTERLAPYTESIQAECLAEAVEWTIGPASTNYDIPIQIHITKAYEHA
jgi:isoleucyl-tRNA synthetase